MIDRPPVPAQLSDFGNATLAALLIGGYLILAEPYVGLVLHRRFEAAVGRFEDARRWLYRRLLLLEWVLAALCLATVLLAERLGLASVGIRLPEGALGIWLSAAAVALALGALVLTAREVTRAERAQHPPQGSESVLHMLPRTPVERRLFGIVAVSAGICEELIFRGFLIAVLAALVPAAPVWLCALIAAIFFGLAHLYQGASGVIATFTVGAVLAGLYVATGSLLAPIVVHALVDLRALSLARLVAPESRH